VSAGITESGTLSLRLPVSGQDELSKLAEDINEMLVTLDQSITALGQQLGRVNLLNQINVRYCRAPGPEQQFPGAGAPFGGSFSG
jgi:methyl-accepting chemotaxis protein